MEDRVFDNFERFFPSIARLALNCRQIDLSSIMVDLEDGDRVMYDDVEKTIRTLPKDPNSLSKDQCSYEFGLRLRRVMTMKGITQEELAERTGLTQTMISLYINGKNNPSFYAVDKIAKALGCSLDDLRYYE
jgi:DNA-binding Xre family transcriptional regulator